MISYWGIDHGDEVSKALPGVNGMRNAGKAIKSGTKARVQGARDASFDTTFGNRRKAPLTTGQRSNRSLAIGGAAGGAGGAGYATYKMRKQQ